MEPWSFVNKWVMLASQMLLGFGFDCWTGEFTHDLCCDLSLGDRGNPECWDASFTYERCCWNQPPDQTPQHTYVSQKLEGHFSAVIRDRQAALERGISECQRRWGWDLNIQWGAPTGIFPEFSGIPLRHQGKGWDGQQHGDANGCVVFRGKFYLVQLAFEGSTSLSKSSHSVHFGFCAPLVCSVKEVVDELVPRYTLQVADARRVMMNIQSVHAWEWPHFLDLVHPDGEAPTLRERILETNQEVQICLIAVLLLLLVATLSDFCGAPGHLVSSFSLLRSWQDLWCPSPGFEVDLLRTPRRL